MSGVTIYVEGGGRRELNAKCRLGFRAFFQKAGLADRLPRVVACGPRHKAYESFRNALQRPAVDRFAILLVDSEGAVKEGGRPWAYLRARDRWARPKRAVEDQAHMMVQCMEAWFLADKDAIAQYFGAGFSSNALPSATNIETVPKGDVARGLSEATRRSRKRGYDKGRDSFALLGQLAPDKVEVASAHAKRLLETLRARSAS